MKKVFELRASNAHRWMNCYGQPQAVAGIPDSSSEAADRGTVAHALLETMLRLNMPTDEIDHYADRYMLAEIDGRPAKHILVDEHMMNGVSYALDYVRGYLSTHKTASYDIECPLDASPFLGYESGGTGDVVLYDLPRELVVVDYKNGVKHVDHVDNDQLHMYALGALNLFSEEITPKTVIRMVIVQPNSRTRDGPVREAVYSYQDLLVFAKRATYAAKQVHSKNPERTAGDHCNYCRAAGFCKTYANRALQQAKLEFSDLGADMNVEDPRNLTLNDLSVVLSSKRLLLQWLESIENEAIRLLLEDKKIPGYKLVGSRPHRKWEDEQIIVSTVEKLAPAMIDELIPRMPLSVSRMEKRLSRKRDGLPSLLVRLRQRITTNAIEPRVAPIEDARPPFRAGREFDEEWNV